MIGGGPRLGIEAVMHLLVGPALCQQVAVQLLRARLPRVARGTAAVARCDGQGLQRNKQPCAMRQAMAERQAARCKMEP